MMCSVVEMRPRHESPEEKRVFAALIAEEKMQRIIEVHDGGFHDVYTRGFNLKLLTKKCREFRRMNSLDKTRFVSKLARSNELALG